MGGATVTKITKPRGRIKENEIPLDELDMDEDLRKALARSRARKKSQNKRLQYNFLFKSGAFLVMLCFVLIMKQVQKLFPDKAGAGGGATQVTGDATAKPEL